MCVCVCVCVCVLFTFSNTNLISNAGKWAESIPFTNVFT